VFRESPSCDPAVAIRTPPRTALPPHTSLCEWREGLRCQKCDRSPNSAACECRWSRMLPQKARCYVSGASTSATRSATADTHPGAFACGGSQLSRGCSTQREHPRCCGCGGSHTANYHGCVKWKEGKAAVAQQAPERSRQSVATGQPAVLEAQRAGPLPSRWTWARCGITSSEGGGGGDGQA